MSPMAGGPGEHGGVGVVERLVCPAAPLTISGRARGAVVGIHTGVGGPVAIGLKLRSHRTFHGCAQGQRAGRCSTRRRCDAAMRAGTFTMRRRRVAPRATPCSVPARVPAARSRWWVMAAQIAQALLVPNRPEVILSRLVDHGPDLGLCLVDGVVDEDSRRPWSARSDEFRSVPVGRVAARSRAEDRRGALFTEGSCERVA